MAADKCMPSGDLAVSLVMILLQDSETVTFSISQYGCEWIATDYFGSGDELTCSKSTCGLMATYTAQCKDGVTVVDMFVHGKLFGQMDGTAVFVPSACDASGNHENESKMCHFRYLLNCRLAQREEETMKAQDCKPVEKGTEK